MRWHSAAVACVVVILLLEVGAASAQQPQQQKRGPQVHRMVIYNGPMRTVAYFGRDLSESDKVLLKDMGQAESDPPPPVVVPVLAPPPQPIPVVAQSVVPFTAVREVTSREVGGGRRGGRDHHCRTRCCGRDDAERQADRVPFRRGERAVGGGDDDGGQADAAECEGRHDHRRAGAMTLGARA